MGVSTSPSPHPPGPIGVSTSPSPHPPGPIGVSTSPSPHPPGPPPRLCTGGDVNVSVGASWSFLLDCRMAGLAVGGVFFGAGMEGLRLAAVSGLWWVLRRLCASSGGRRASYSRSTLRVHRTATFRGARSETHDGVRGRSETQFQARRFFGPGRGLSRRRLRGGRVHRFQMGAHVIALEAHSAGGGR